MNRIIFRVVIASLFASILIIMGGCGTTKASPEDTEPSDSIFLPLVVRGTPEPGLSLSGHVRLQDGTPLEGVAILRNYASYPPVQVATTDHTGFYQSAFAPIPGDEMITILPELAGYKFDPPKIRWRHYYGFEDIKLDFIAIPIP